MPTRRAVLAASLALGAGAARAQPAWPAGPIRIIAPFPPGGSVDTIARLLVPALQVSLGVPVVVENRSGAAGRSAPRRRRGRRPTAIPGCWSSTAMRRPMH
ncbi:hypothetical protein ACFQY5_01205 [Paeniroseomonas aquatica]|uniref:hypothetical protein n=1 Tax=Paeniroseomonas aquatica TaxID=373043 RepID=UPI00360DF734